MTDVELRNLAPVFRPGERRLDRKLIDWATADYRIFYWLRVLRQAVGVPLLVIRETHLDRKGEQRPWDHTAVDCTLLGASLARVFLELCRLPGLSWGLYSGGSIHVDLREWDESRGELPARWLAVRPDEIGLLEDRGLGHLVVNREEAMVGGKAWAYLRWSDPHSVRALMFVLELAKEGA